MNELESTILKNENSIIFKANFYVILSGILYGFLGYLGTEVLHTKLSIVNMLFWRFIVAGVWMLVFAFKRHYKTDFLTHLNKHALLIMFVLGAIGYSGASGFYFLASRYTGTGLAMVIFFSYPIMIVIYAWLVQNKKITISTFLTMIFLILGLYLLQDSHKYTLSFIGILFGLLSAVSYAFYMIGSKKYSSIKIDSMILTIMVCFGCAFIFFIFTLLTHSLVFPLKIRSWLFLLALGIFATALPIQLMLEGLKHVSSTRASIFSVLEPLVTLFAGILLLHETVTTLQLAGAFIILAGTLLVPFQRE